MVNSPPCTPGRLLPRVENALGWGGILGKLESLEKTVIVCLLKNALIEPAKHPQKVCTSWIVKEVGLVSKESALLPPRGSGCGSGVLTASALCVED